MKRILLLAAAMLGSGPVGAQTSAPLPEEDGSSIYACGTRIRPAPPSEAAMALGRRLAMALHPAAIAARVEGILTEAGAYEEAPPPSAPGGALRPNDRPVRAVGSVRPLRNMSLGLELQNRAIDRVADFYARRYPVSELRQMVSFFESPVGRKYHEDREQMSAEVRDLLRSDALAQDLREAVCDAGSASGPRDGPNHGYVRLPPQVTGESSWEPPAWCGNPSRAPDGD